MPTNRTKRGRAGKSLDYWKLDSLITGDHLLSGPGYGYFPSGATGGCGHWTAEEWAEVRAAMLADWERYGAEFMAWWRGRTERFSAAYASIGGKVRDPAITPWALREFGEPTQ